MSHLEKLQAVVREVRGDKEATKTLTRDEVAALLRHILEAQEG